MSSKRKVCLVLLPPFYLGLRIRDPGSRIRIRDEKTLGSGSGIKHPGSATVVAGDEKSRDQIHLGESMFKLLACVLSIYTCLYNSAKFSKETYPCGPFGQQINFGRFIFLKFFLSSCYLRQIKFGRFIFQTVFLSSCYLRQIKFGRFIFQKFFCRHAT
jgi:hypothetical protein